MRRVYREGRCGDCGHIKRVTEIVFWVNGMRMLVCAECIKPYRYRILKPAAAPRIAQLGAVLAAAEERGDVVMFDRHPEAR
jgi:hypothetical protein